MANRRLHARLFAVVIAALLGLTACAGASGDKNSGLFKFTSATKIGTLIPVSNRKPISPVAGTLLDGSDYSLTTGRGHVVLINFWAAWCGTCRTESPQLDLLYRQVKSQGVQFVGVDTKEVNRSAGTSFIADNDISYPSLWDESGKIAIELGNVPASGLPFTVLVDKQQRVAAIYLGNLTPADLRPPLGTLAAEPN